MIADFLASWPLFHDAYLAGWAMGLALSLTGVLVVARDQIFFGAAIAEASTLGVALALWAGASDPAASAFAVAASLLAAFWIGRESGPGAESREARGGWVFLLAAAGAVLLVSHSPHGLEEIHRLLSSSLIGATGRDLAVFAALASLAAAAALFLRERLLLLAVDPSLAQAVGMRVGLWNGALSVWLGVLTGISIQSGGFLYAFGCLVLPALIARGLCREARRMFAVAPAVFLVLSAAGFVLANAWDYPPAQMVVFCHCAALSAAWGQRRLARRG